MAKRNNKRILIILLVLIALAIIIGGKKETKVGVGCQGPSTYNNCNDMFSVYEASNPYSTPDTLYIFGSQSTTCTGDNYIICIDETTSSGCSGSIINTCDFSSPTCSDPDGDDIFTKGTTTSYEGSLTDYCWSSDEVIEYVCFANAILDEKYDCPSGYGCNDGKCVEASTTTTPSTTTTILGNTVCCREYPNPLLMYKAVGFYCTELSNCVSGGNVIREVITSSMDTFPNCPSPCGPATQTCTQLGGVCCPSDSKECSNIIQGTGCTTGVCCASAAECTAPTQTCLQAGYYCCPSSKTCNEPKQAYAGCTGVGDMCCASAGKCIVATTTTTIPNQPTCTSDGDCKACEKCVDGQCKSTCEFYQSCSEGECKTASWVIGIMAFVGIIVALKVVGSMGKK